MELLEKAQTFVFLLSDGFFLRGGFVFIPKQVKNSVNDYSSKFNLKREFQTISIISNPVDADIDFPRNLLRFRIIECDDVCEVIVFEIVAIDVQEIIIRAKDNIKADEVTALALHYFLNPIGDFAFALKTESNICFEETNAGGLAQIASVSRGTPSQ